MYRKVVSVLSSRLYYIHKRVIETYTKMNLKFMNPNIFVIWYERLGDLGSIMMRRLIENFNGHQLKNKKILLLMN